MKKKFVLTLALVLLVAATITAAPVTVTGSIKAGYKMTFNPNAITALDTSELDLDGIAVTGDFWKVSIGSGPIAFGKDDVTKGSMEIYLDKALAAEGVDMGDLTVTLGIGNSGTKTGLTVYTDPNGTAGDNDYKLRQKGDYSSSATVGYGSMLKANVTVDPTDATNKPFQVSAQVSPVDGIKAAVGYTNYADNKFASTVDAKGAVGGSVAVDVAALAGLDFALTASAQDVYYMGGKDNYLMAAVKATVSDITAYSEYQLFNKVSNLVTKVSYAGIENVGLYAKLTLNDFASIKTIVGLGASYKMGGVTYALDGDYAVATEITTIKPSVKISF